MNSDLGPFKKVNVILVGFGNKDSSYGQYQQAKWVGGKKNDLVITFGGGSKKNPASWAFVFGWTEKELVKRRLESLLMNTPINDDIIPLIQKEIIQNYEIKDWSKFDYITVEPPTWSYWVFMFVLIGSQIGVWYMFITNGIDKDPHSAIYNMNFNKLKLNSLFSKLNDRLHFKIKK
jgi:hypothetical protein